MLLLLFVSGGVGTGLNGSASLVITAAGSLGIPVSARPLIYINAVNKTAVVRV